MPESPEVQALAEFVAERSAGRRVREIELEEFRALKTPARPLSELHGATVGAVSRHGKHIELEFATPGEAARHLVVSFGRAGWATWAERDDTDDRGDAGDQVGAPAPVIARLRFDDGATLGITDAGAWLSLGLSVVDDPADVPAIAKLGPDPTASDFTFDRFVASVGRRRKQLKALLQEQESLSGIGNAYSDEILHVARLSPVAHAADLSDDERMRLFEAVRSVLIEATAARRGIPIASLKAAKVAAMRVHGRAGEACPVCGGTILDIPGTKTGAQFCPTCQGGTAPATLV